MHNAAEIFKNCAWGEKPNPNNKCFSDSKASGSRAAMGRYGSKAVETSETIALAAVWIGF
jgi:hypothetical protein